MKKNISQLFSTPILKEGRWIMGEKESLRRVKVIHSFIFSLNYI